jgi:hypothetical protein
VTKRVAKRTTKVQVHVYANLGGAGGWRIEVNGRVVAPFHATKTRAVNAARVIYKLPEQAELYLHNRLGRIGKRDTRGTDPVKSKG